MGWFTASTFLLFGIVLVGDILSIFLPFSVGGVVGEFGFSAPPTSLRNLLGAKFFNLFALCYALLQAASACCGLSALTLGSLLFVDAKRARHPLRASVFFLCAGAGARVGMLATIYVLCLTPPGLWGGSLGTSFFGIGAAFAANVGLLSSVLHVARFPHLLAAARAPPGAPLAPLAVAAAPPPPPARGGGGGGGKGG